jgi:exonuclease SbcC
MIPIELRIEGFLSYHDVVEIDFTGFTTACISGNNGSGKSSLLDAITWVLFGEARRRDDAVINNRTQRENKPAKVSLIFEYEGQIYRVQRIKQKDKTATLDFFIKTDRGTWKSLTTNTMRSTEEYIQQTLHLDYETFVNASFFLQGKADQFSQQKPADRKRILSNILRLDIWEQYREEVMNRRRLLESDLTLCENRLSEINNVLETEDECRENLETLLKEHKAADVLVKTTKSLLEKKRLIVDRQQSDREQLKKQMEEISRLLEEYEHTEETLQDRKSDYEQYLEEIKNEDEIRNGHKVWLEHQKRLTELNSNAIVYQKLVTDRETVISQIDSKRKVLENSIQTLADREMEIKELENECNKLLGEIDKSKKIVENLLTTNDKIYEVEHKLVDIHAQMNGILIETQAVKREYKGVLERYTVLTESEESVCPVCEKALSASEKQKLVKELKEEVDKLKATITASDEKYSLLHKDEENLAKELLRFEDTKALLDAEYKSISINEDRLHHNQREIKVWNGDKAKQLEDMMFAMEHDKYALDERSRLRTILGAIGRCDYSEVQHRIASLNEEEYRKFQDKLNQLEKAKSALIPLEREIKNLEKSCNSAREHLSVLEKEYKAFEKKLSDTDDEDIEEVETAYLEAQGKADNLLKDIGYSRSLVDSLEDMKGRKSLEDKKRLSIFSEIAQLKTLDKAFGKDGIPTLLIEQALPEIESYANNLLDRLSNGSMQISFETQKEYKDINRKDRKETLDIIIKSSSEDRAYELLSGGEAFRVNFAIRLALSNVLANRAGAHLSTLVIDEGFGSQDADGQQRLIEAINSVSEEFSMILVITHLEELKEAFPAQIDVVKKSNGSQIEVKIK